MGKGQEYVLDLGELVLENFFVSTSLSFLKEAREQVIVLLAASEVALFKFIELPQPLAHFKTARLVALLLHRGLLGHELDFLLGDRDQTPQHALDVQEFIRQYVLEVNFSELSLFLKVQFLHHRLEQHRISHPIEQVQSMLHSFHKAVNVCQILVSLLLE